MVGEQCCEDPRARRLVVVLVLLLMAIDGATASGDCRY